MSIINTIVPPSKPIKDYKILVLGEAPGETEVKLLKPFCGRSGQLLDICWQKSGLKAQDLYITNVFKIRPDKNNAKLFFTKTIQKNKWTKSHHGYVKDEFAFYLDNLFEEIKEYSPRVILGLGKVAHWALDNMQLDSKIEIKKFYHPSYILRTSSLRSEYINRFEFLKSYILEEEQNKQQLIEEIKNEENKK